MSNSDLKAKLAKKLQEQSKKIEQQLKEQQSKEQQAEQANLSKETPKSPNADTRLADELHTLEYNAGTHTPPTPKIIPVASKKTVAQAPPTLLKQSLRKSKKAIKRAWFYSANVSNETLVSEEKVRQVGLIYALYRILMAMFLLLSGYMLDKTAIRAFSGSISILPSGIEKMVVALYFVGALALGALLYLYQQHTRKQLLVGFALDMAMLTLILYSSVATDLQVVLLYMVVVAASFMLLRLIHAVAITFLAVVSLAFQQLYYLLHKQAGFLSFGDAAMLSVSLVAVGFLSWSISQRLANAEQDAARQAREIMRLNAINEEVIKNMESGIIVVANSGRILMINRTAQELLNLNPNKIYGNNLERILEAQRILVRQYPELDKWYRYQNDEQTFFLTPTEQTESLTNRLRISKKHLPEFGQLLIVEDLSLEQHLAQQLKLASLGQLSASIAHEIRNPLSVISQASEMMKMLNQANDGDETQTELCEMIFSHTKRINRIIEDVMRLSRQEPPRQEVITLQQWLPNFLYQYYSMENIAFDASGFNQIRFDTSQLEQIFINLINNAIRHTKKVAGRPDVEIVVHSTSQDLLIDVLDNGDGVSEQGLQSLFNPFFTTSKGGTGLGLYLSQAFSEANNARLIYVPNQGRTCFRLITAMVA